MPVGGGRCGRHSVPRGDGSCCSGGIPLRAAAACRIRGKRSGSSACRTPGMSWPCHRIRHCCSSDKISSRVPPITLPWPGRPQGVPAPPEPAAGGRRARLRRAALRAPCHRQSGLFAPILPYFPPECKASITAKPLPQRGEALPKQYEKEYRESKISWRSRARTRSAPDYGCIPCRFVPPLRPPGRPRCGQPAPFSGRRRW